MIYTTSKTRLSDGGETAGESRSFSPLVEWKKGLDKIFGVGGGPKQSYSNSPYVYACVNVWMRIGRVPWQLQTRAPQPSQVTSGAINFLLNHPNSGMTQGDFKEYTAQMLGLFGEAFFDLGSTEKVTSLMPVSPESVSIGPSDIDTSGNLISWTVRNRTGERTIPVARLLHIKLPNPYDPNRGLAPVTALRVSIDADYAARMHNKKQMQNRGRIEGVVMYDEDHDPAYLNKLGHMWKRMFGGSGNAGKWAHLSGVKEIKQLSQSMKDLDWLQGQKLNREEICAAFGVPPVMVGILDRATYNNYAFADMDLWRNTLVGLEHRITRKVEARLVPPNQQLVSVYDKVAAMREDNEKRIRDYTELVNRGFVTPAAAAELTGVALGGHDDAHDQIWIPFSVTTSTDYMTPTPMLPPSPEPGPEPDEKRIDAIRKSKEEGEAARERLRSALWKSLTAGHASRERAYGKQLKKYFYDQRSEVLENMARLVNAIKSHDITRASDLPMTPTELTATLLGKQDWDALLLGASAGHIDDACKVSAVALLAEINSPAAYDPAIMSAFRKGQNKLLVKVNKTTSDALLATAHTMEQAIKAGANVAEAAAAMEGDLKHVFRNTEARRHTIARTEINRAYNGARTEQSKEAGIKKHEWLSSRDDVVRDEHAHMDGEIADINGVFSNGASYPGGGDVNCRCTSIPVIE